ncbi:MAG: T9SS type A sorting domain-containing protein [Saprospiraceae bacterium]|nr:T9SS type A sorting domain-containing protein [Saprospiraceae bacterium]MBK8297893.1 T9SS type A sorting domain-containing protein [Saprospiraceae bacterium]
MYDYTFNSTGLGIKYKSCYGDTITICGDYTLPTVCGTWALDSIEVPGFTVLNLEINHTSHTYCFELAKPEFPEDSCSELYAISYFSSNLTGFTSNASNSIVICDDEFESYIAFDTVGICQNNNTSTLISDDYYYLKIDLNVNYGDTWSMQRILDNPYPNESGSYVIKTGTGSGIINLGPLLIQEGTWELSITIGGCILNFEIIPPDFCSGCSKFYRTKIFDFTCSDNNGGTATLDPSDDHWYFIINVPGLTGNYTLTKAGGSPGTYSYGLSPTHNHIIHVGAIGHECVKYTLKDAVLTQCIAEFYVCPPKPCSDDDECELEFYITDVNCEEGNSQFYVELDITGGSSYLCYKASKATDGSTISQGGFSSILGPFTEDIWLDVKICTTAICTCAAPYCYKVIYVPFPDCENLEFRSKETSYSGFNSNSELIVLPNPINGNEMILLSSMKFTRFELYNASGKLIHYSSFSGPEYRYNQAIPVGLYFVKYKNSKEEYRIIKIVKM